MTDKQLAEISQLSYINLPDKFKRKVEKGSYTHELCYKYQDSSYSNLRGIDFANDNSNTGYAGYEIKEPSGNVVIASRGSESPCDAPVNEKYLMLQVIQICL